MTVSILSKPIGSAFPGRRTGREPSLPAFRVKHRVSFYVVIILLAGFLGPSEAAVRLGISLTMLRIAIIAALVPVFLEFCRKVVRGGYVPVVSDFAAVLLAFWMVYGLYVVNGAQAATSAAALAGVDFLIAYLVGRCFCGTYEGFEQFVRILAGFAVVLLCLGAVDVLAHDNILAKISGKIFGVTRSRMTGSGVVVEFQTQYRFGLVRVRGPFEQSIHYGTFFALLVPLFFYVIRTAWARIAMVGVAVAGVLMSVSSAAIICCFVLLTFISFDVALNRSQWRWAFVVCAAGYAILLLFLLVDNPLYWLIAEWTLTPSTGFYRLQQWHWVGYNLSTSPVFGIGISDWVRPVTIVNSLDSLWLVQAIRHGYVGVALLALALVGCFIAWTPRPTPAYRHPKARVLRMASTHALLGAIGVSFTIHYWGRIWVFLALLAGIRAGLTEAPYLHPIVRGDRVPDARV